MESGLTAQTEQALRNVLAVLKEGGVSQSDVVKSTRWSAP
jgi:enamine deaminase RidA (YjgF/YER057c/UK114 family)